MLNSFERVAYPAVIGALLCTLVYLGLGLFGVWDESKTQLGASLPQGPAVFETSLQDRISSTDTSLTLVSGTVRGGTALSGYNCFTIDEGRTDMEYVCGTVSGTSVTGLERGIDPVTSTTTNSTVKFAHRKGANVKITDFPLIQRVRNQLSGTETITTLIFYATSTTDCSVSSPDDTICDKEYVDGVVVAGASNANETTKGIVEFATQSEAASSSTAGGTGALLAYGNGMATDTPNTATRATRLLMSDMGGYLKQAWLNLTEAFTWTGNQTWQGATNSFASGSKLGIGTSTPYAPLSVVGQAVASYFTATSTTATSSLPSLQVTGAATTTNLTISGVCDGCFKYTASSTAFSNSSSGTYTGAIPTFANTALAVFTIVEGGSSNERGNLMFARSGLSTVTVDNIGPSIEANACIYDFAWSGSDFTLTETDIDGDCSISGTVYWYR